MNEAELKKLRLLLAKFATLIGAEQPLAGQVIRMIQCWVDEEIGQS